MNIKKDQKVYTSTNFKTSNTNIANLDKMKGRNNNVNMKRISTNSSDKTNLGRLLKTNINEKLLLYSVFEGKTIDNRTITQNNEVEVKHKAESNNKIDIKISLNISKKSK